MTDRMQWILFFAVVGCLLTVIGIVLQVLHRRHGRNVPPGDIGAISSSIDNANEDAARNQESTQRSISAARTETRVASEGIRVQIASNQTDNELTQEHNHEKLNWIKSMIASWFTVV